jgi:hypothetical protein
LEPPPDVDGAGVEEEVVDEDELSFEEDDEDELSLDEEGPSDELELLRLSVR